MTFYHTSTFHIRFSWHTHTHFVETFFWCIFILTNSEIFIRSGNSQYESAFYVPDTSHKVYRHPNTQIWSLSASILLSQKFNTDIPNITQIKTLLQPFLSFIIKVVLIRGPLMSLQILITISTLVFHGTYLSKFSERYVLYKSYWKY